MGQFHTILAFIGFSTLIRYCLMFDTFLFYVYIYISLVANLLVMVLEVNRNTYNCFNLLLKIKCTYGNLNTFTNIHFSLMVYS